MILCGNCHSPCKNGFCDDQCRDEWRRAHKQHKPAKPVSRGEGYQVRLLQGMRRTNRSKRSA
jgi:hypothetical protein